MMKPTFAHISRARALPLLLGLAMAASLACGQQQAATADAGKTPSGKVVAGVRYLPIEVLDSGYRPDKLTAKPGEKLMLVFTRKSDSACVKQVKIAGGTPVDLPLNEAKELPVTMPATGQLQFTCGMDMVTGVIVPAT